MVYSAFIDVNILVDFFLPDRKCHDDSRILVQLAEEGRIKLFLSESVINTTAYLLRKSKFLDFFKQAMIEINTFLTLLPCSSEMIRYAYKTAKNDLEDAVLYQVALHGKMDYFVTSDIKDLKKIASPLLPVVSAKQMLEMV